MKKKCKTKRTKHKFNQGGEIMGMVQGLAPLLNLAAPGLGTGVGMAAGMIGKGMQENNAPSTYQPLSPASNKYGLAMGGDLTAMGQNSVEVNANNPNMTDSVELSTAFVDNDEIISKMGDGSTYVFPDDKINPLTGNKYSEDAKKLAQSDAKAERRKYDPEAKNTLKHNEQIRSKFASVNELENMQHQMFAQYGKSKANFKLGGALNNEPPLLDDDGNEIYIADGLPEATVTASRQINRSVEDFNTFSPNKTVENVRAFQEAQGLTPDGQWGPKTEKVYRDMQGMDTTSMWDPSKQETVKSKRREFQEKVRQAGQQIKPGDFFGMDQETKDYITGRTGEDLSAGDSECIGGVCTFLRDQVGEEFDTPKGVYYSNYTFQEDAGKKGWQMYKGTEVDMPQIGDIIQTERFYPGGRSMSRHANLITDFDESTGKYTMIDNKGEDTARVRHLTGDELKSYMKKHNANFFRKTQYDGQDLYGQNEKYDIPSEFVDQSTNEQGDVSISYKKDKAFDFKRKKYLKGINEVLQGSSASGVDAEDLKRVGLISAAIPHNESARGASSDSGYGQGLTYMAESTFPGLARLARNAKAKIQGRDIDMDRQNSVGLSQISSSMLSNSIKQKYFKGMSDSKITRKLARDENLAGKITAELMLEKYEQQRKDPALYGGDETKFWEALTYRHKNPNFFKTEQGKRQLENLDLSYVNNAFEAMSGYSATESREKKVNRALGGTLPIQLANNNTMYKKRKSQVKPLFNRGGILSNKPNYQGKGGAAQISVGQNANTGNPVNWVQENILAPFAPMDYSKYKQQRNNIAMQRIEADRAAEQYNSMYPNAAPLPSTTGNMMNTIIPTANDTNWNYAPKQMLKSGGKMKMSLGNILQDPPRDTIPVLDPLTTNYSMYDPDLAYQRNFGTGPNQFAPRKPRIGSPMGQGSMAGAPMPNTGMINNPPFQMVGSPARPYVGNPAARDARTDLGGYKPVESTISNAPPYDPIVTPQMNMEEGAPGQFPVPEAFTIPLNPLDPTNAAGRTVPTESVAPTVSQAELEAATSGQEALPQPGAQGQPKTGTRSTRRSTASNIGQNPFSSADQMKMFQRYAGIKDDGIWGPKTSAAYANQGEDWRRQSRVDTSWGTNPNAINQPLGMLPTRSGYSDANPHEAQTWNRGLVDIENLGDEVAANNIAAGVVNAAKRITGTERDSLSAEELYPRDRLGVGLQLASLAGQAGMLAGKTEVQKLRQASSPITRQQFDPRSSLASGQTAFNAARQQARNTTSRASMMGNLQNLASNAARQQSQITDRYNQMNAQAQTQYEARVGQREAQNLQRRYAVDQMNSQNRAAHRRGAGALLQSVNNLGQARVAQTENRKSVDLILQTFPMIREHFLAQMDAQKSK